MKTLITILTLLISITLTAQSTYTVDNKPGAPADYDNLQTAIDAVPAGSTILVQGSPTNYGNVTITKEIHIIGSGYFLGQNPNTQSYMISTSIQTSNFNTGANNSSISGISGNVYANDVSNISISRIVGRTYITDSHNINISASYLNGYSQYGSVYYGNYIYGNCSGIIYKGCYLKGRIRFEQNSNGLMVSLINNVLASGSIGGNAVIAFDAVRNNIIQSNESVYFGYNLDDYSNIQNNLFKASAIGGLIHGNQYYIDMSNVFIESTDPRYSDDGRFILKAGSPAIGAGVNGIDCGMFGGGYRLSGIPNIPNIYEFTVPDTGYTNDGGVPITIKVNSNN